MQHYDVGEPAVLEVTFANEAGDATNPTTVALEIVGPDGTVTTIAQGGLTNPSTGRWRYVLTPALAGVWRYTYTGTGDVAAVESDLFAVGLGGRTGACEPWCTWTDVANAAKGLTQAQLDSIDAATRESIIDSATNVLYGLTGGRYPGLCSSTFGLCPARRCGRSCEYRSCTGLADHVDLGDVGWPVWAASDVFVDGVEVPYAGYRIDERRWLVRLDGELWPTCPDLREPDNARATVVYGRAPYAGGNMAAAALCAQALLMALPGGTCAGDDVEGVTALVREGVTYSIDPKEFAEGRTGVGATDLWLAAEKKSRRVAAGGFDPAREPQTVRLGTDRGLDR